MLLRKLFRTAWRYKSQFFSMIIMVTIGMGIFVGFNIEWYSLEKLTENYFEDYAYADFRLYSETGFSEDDIEKIKNIEGIDAATRFLSLNIDLDNSKKSVALMVSENYTVSKIHIIDGAKYDENAEGLWLSDKFANQNDIKIGDTMTFSYMGQKIELDVIGLAKSCEMMICVADENQLMPDYDMFGFAYISPKQYESILPMGFYPQINVLSDMEKPDIEKAVSKALGKTTQILSKDEHVCYAGAMGEVEEGKTMGAILPVLFLAIGILTMITTMHRIAANEKVQIGTLKALGFKDRRILRHYTSYGFFIGIVGVIIGIILGYYIASLFLSPTGTMSTYIDFPDWKLSMPFFCIPVVIITIIFLTLVSYFSVKKMLKGTAADALRPYTPKAMKKSFIEKFKFWEKLSFGTKWNMRDVIRHKSRSAMTLVGVFGCMLLLVGGLGMKDTMEGFLDILDKDVTKYKTKVTIAENASIDEVKSFAESVDGDWVSNTGISYEGETVALEVYNADKGRICFIGEDNKNFKLEDDGVYLCLRLKDTAEIGDEIEFSPYGSEETYKVKVIGYLRSVTSECLVMTDACADRLGIDYKISSVFTNFDSNEIEASSIITGKQDKQKLMESYDEFMSIMDMMVWLFVIFAVLLGIVVLYNLGIMSYVERYRELATLKVLGFCDKKIGKLLISQNIWLTVIGVVIGLPGGVGVLYILIKALASDYELSLKLGPLTYCVSILVTFGVSLFVGLMVSKKNKHIDMVEALKGAE